MRQTSTTAMRVHKGALLPRMDKGKADIDYVLLFQIGKFSALHDQKNEPTIAASLEGSLNYILWLQDIIASHRKLGWLLDAFEGRSDGRRDRNEPVYGYDVGTGASAIYPLLGCASNPSWNFVATEIDPLSQASAQSNIERNGLQDRIKLHRVTSNAEPLFSILHPSADLVALEGHGLGSSERLEFDFTMCNPPFYSSQDEIDRSAEGKAHRPNGICTGAETEMITPGGEAAFVKRMIVESLELENACAQHRCRWYTSMLGKLSSLPEIVKALKEREITNYAVTEFVQGQTRRWAIAWSVEHIRLEDALARPLSTSSNPLLAAHLPPKNAVVYEFQLRTAEPLSEIKQLHTKLLEEVLKGVEGLQIGEADTMADIMADDNDGTPGGLGKETSTFRERSAFEVYIAVEENTWSRSARRRKKFGGTVLSDRNDIEIDIPQGQPELRRAGVGMICHIRWALTKAGSSDHLAPHHHHEMLLSPSLSSASQVSLSSSSPPLPPVTKPGSSQPSGGRRAKLEFRWMYGKERNLFESFSGHVERKMEGR